MLGDNDNDIEHFFEEFEDVTSLFNTGKGMPQKEKLRVLGSCLKGSRARVYRNMRRWAREAGHLDTDPTRVYEDIRDQLMEYRQTTMERRTQADMNFTNAEKQYVRSAIQIAVRGSRSRAVLDGTSSRWEQGERTRPLHAVPAKDRPRPPQRSYEGQALVRCDRRATCYISRADVRGRRHTRSFTSPSNSRQGHAVS